MSTNKASDDILSDSEGSEGWDDVDEGGDEDGALEVVSLFDSSAVFPDVAAMLAHCKDKHNFDFVAVRDRLGLDFYGSIKLVNYIRSTVKDGKALPDHISEADVQDERLLMPVLRDDAFIMCLDELPPSPADANNNANAAVAGSGETLADKNAALQSQLEELTKQFANYRLAVEQTLDKRWHADDDDDGSSTSSSAEPKEKEDDSKYYWESYASYEIHETMLKDTVRTDAYRDFIYNNKHLFAGKTVLDIGCGTGILSMFCAKAGAAHVYAIDKSAILDKARANIYHNGLSRTITCLRGRVEDITLPVDKVDIIVSEWMGYCLLYEAMLPSVLHARDRFLRPDTGLLVPSHATLFVAPVSDPDYVADSVDFWDDVYGFDMRAAMRDADSGLFRETRVQVMPPAAVCGSASAVPLDLYTCRVEDLTFRAPWASTLARDVDAVDGFLVWFDNYFATTRRAANEPPELIEEPAAEWERRRADGSNAFTTGPHGKETHWKQGFLMIEDKTKEGGAARAYKAGDEIKGYLSFAAAENHARGLDIKVEWDGLPNAEKVQKWDLH